MISLEKWMMLTPVQKLPNNVGNLGKIIVATGFEWLSKVQKIAQSGHTGPVGPSAYILQVCNSISEEDFISNRFYFDVKTMQKKDPTRRRRDADVVRNNLATTSESFVRRCRDVHTCVLDVAQSAISWWSHVQNASENIPTPSNDSVGSYELPTLYWEVRLVGTGVRLWWNRSRYYSLNYIFLFLKIRTNPDLPLSFSQNNNNFSMEFR